MPIVIGPRVARQLAHTANTAGRSVQRAAEELRSASRKRLDVFEGVAKKFLGSDPVQRSVDFLQATWDSFEDAVRGRSPADPAPLREDRERTTWTKPAGQLVVDGIRPQDVQQGRASDCFFLSTIASCADVDPELIRRAIRDNGDGSFTVTFHVPPGFKVLKALGPAGGMIQGGVLGLADRFGLETPARTVEITVDGDFPQRGGKNVYAAMPGNELWPAIMEKAYAKLWNNYGAIGNGGSPAAAMFALTGKSVESHAITPTGRVGLKVGTVQATPERCAEVFADLSQATRENKLVVASTYITGGELLPGLDPGHCYTVLETRERDGKRLVVLRNPYAVGEPGNDGRNEGVFELPIEQFVVNYASYDIGDR